MMLFSRSASLVLPVVMCAAVGAYPFFPESYPRAVGTAFYAAGVHAQISGDVDTALRYFRFAGVYSPGMSQVCARKGFIAMLRGDTAAAADRLSLSADMDPGDVSLQAAAARILALNGSRRAARFLARIRNLPRLHPATAREMADLYRRIGMWASAVGTYAGMLFENNLLLPVALEIAETYMQQAEEEGRKGDAAGRTEALLGALRWYDEALRVKDAPATVFLARARCFYGLYDYRSAARDCYRYLAANPRDIAAGLFLARILVRMERFKDAARWYERLTAGGNCGAQVYAEYVGVLLSLKDYRRAAEVADRMVAVAAGDPFLTVLAARCMLSAGRRRRAVELAQAALGASKRLKNRKDADEIAVEALHVEAGAAMAEGNVDEAMKRYERILEMDPYDPAANNNLGYLLLERGGDVKRAHMLVVRALIRRPLAGEYLDSLGWVYYKMGRKEEALKVLLKAARLSRHEEIFTHVGEVCLALGNVKEARMWLKKALRLNPRFGRAEELLKSIERR